MRSSLRICGYIAAVVVAAGLFSNSALAGPLATDPNAMAGWKGMQNFYAYDAGLDKTIDVDVEYAVYDPGLYGGDDPSGGAEYVYAYQIFNDLTGDTQISSFSVGLDTSADPDSIGSDGTYGTVGGTAPSISALSGSPPTSAVWYFFNNTIDPPPTNEYSEVLLFTSPYGPMWAPSSLLNGGLSNTQDLPSPTPEPATVGLMALGIGGVLIRRKRR